MDYRPDWKSFLLLKLLGKKRLITLLDAAQLMWRQDYQQTPSYERISKEIIFSCVCVNSFIVAAYLITNRTLFRSVRIFSPLKLLSDCGLVFVGYYAGGLYLSQKIQKEVSQGKDGYLKAQYQSFLFHFNYISSKYGIIQQQQLQDIFSKSQFKEWFDKYLQLNLRVQE